MEIGPSLEWFPAPGKLNLLLHVLGRRADGMHELQTVYRLVAYGDRVGVRLRADHELRFSGAFGEENLCLRAARLLRAETGVPHTLAGLNVDDAKADQIVEMAPKDPTAGGNPVKLDKRGARTIFNRALEGRL